MERLEDLGLLKMDFLGLRTLTVIQDSIAFIKENHGVEINVEKMTCDDEKVVKTLEKYLIVSSSKIFVSSLLNSS